jgi:hypothetical protein
MIPLSEIKVSDTFSGKGVGHLFQTSFKARG